MKKLFKYLFISIPIIIILLIPSYFFYTKQFLPQLEGKIFAPKIKRKILITRNEWGIPHIQAFSNSDAYFALGFAMAQDRLWQMDVIRYAGKGKLSQILPKTQEIIEADQLTQALSIQFFSRQYYQRLLASNDPIDQMILASFQSFVDGINFFIQKKTDRWSIEFKILGYQPKPFTIVDSLMTITLLASGFNNALNIETPLLNIVQKIGLKNTLQIIPNHPPIQNISKLELLLPQNLFPKNTKFLSLHQNLMSLPASNAWVVSGKKSQNQKPILANDPHLEIRFPSVWYEAHLETPTLNFTGFFAPLIPFGLIGKNQNIAWGITVMLVDDADFYIEKIKKQNSQYFYFYKNQWKLAQVNTITLSPNEKIKIPITNHGPIISSIFKNIKKDISMKWSFYDPDNHPVKTFFLLNRAKNWKQFKKALQNHKSPGLNFIYADTENNIGYYPASSIPIRTNKSDGIFPMDGSSGDFDWIGYFPLAQKYTIFNPKNQFIVSANHDIFQSPPYYISAYFDHPSRAQRIQELITKKKILSLDDHKAIQADHLSKKAQILVPILIQSYQSVAENKISPLEKKALLLLKKWNYSQNIHSVPATIYNYWEYKTLEIILTDKLNPEQFKNYSKSYLRYQVLPHLFKNMNSWWFDLTKTPKNETRDDIIRQSFQMILSQLTQSLGNQIENWQWGKVHKIPISHPFGKIKPLNLLFGIGNFSFPGNQDSINRSIYRKNQADQIIQAASMRMIIDFSQFSKPSMINSLEQSGHFNNKHYKNQNSLWLDHKYRKYTQKKSQQKKIILIPKL